MRKLLALLTICFLFSCGDSSDKLIVKGNIKGLKKGSVYLKKAQDTLLITVDSLMVNGDSSFELEYDIKEPEMFYLYIDKDDTEDNRISFFADKGITEINTSLKQFVYNAKVEGSKQQEILQDFLKMNSKFTNKNLELVKQSFEALKNNDTLLAEKTEADYKNLERKQYLYTTNFALNNKDSEVAPYLALTELYNANIKLLDTINNALTPKIKASVYGKELQRFINKIKDNEKKN